MSNVILSDSKIIVGEQDDGSLVYPDGSRVTVEQREIIVGNSLGTPIRQEEGKIKGVIRDSIASIIMAETGSGKTTELQQMIHEVYPNDEVITNIPLVASTIGTATYVSDILYAKTGNPNYLLGGDLIGYRTGRGNSSKKRTKLTNNTFGLDYLNVSLGNFESNLNLTNKNYHIILDEIHEKGEDFIFYLKKILELAKKYPGRIKLYGASATISDDYLSLLNEQFSILTNDVPVLNIDGRTHPIDSKENNGKDYIKEAVELYSSGRSILIFQPGKGEIESTIKKLKESLGENISIHPFHSDISGEELENVLEHNNQQKIFVATNAARTGVTLDISGVVDEGLQKSQYYNKSGIPVLSLENITKDAQKQNEGRAGRKEPGVAIYTGKTKIEDLKEEAPSSVEIKVDEKKILMELLGGENILSNELNKDHKYLYKPNIRMLNISYKWMKKAGLMTDDEKLTNYGFEVLKFPVSVFGGRVILESIVNGVSNDVIPMVSIMENKGFIKKAFDYSRFPNDFILSSYSDLESQFKIYELLVSRNAPENLLNVLVNLGVSRKSVEIFKNLGGKVKLYEQIKDDLEKIGISYKSLVKIESSIEKINEYIVNNEIDLEINDKVVKKAQENKEKIISRTLLSGYTHFVYKAVGDDKLVDISGENNGIEFKKSDTSNLNLENGKLYIGQPFIIGGDGAEKKDLEILSFLTEIDSKHLEYYESREYRKYKPAESYSPENFPSDIGSDPYRTPSHLIDTIDKKKYLGKVWLPHFLVTTNPYFKNLLISNPELDEGETLLKLSAITLKHSDKIDPFDKQSTVKKFIDDTQILEQFLKYSDNIEIPNTDDIELSKSDFYNYMGSVSEHNRILLEAQKYISGKKLDVNYLKSKYLGELISILGFSSENYRNLLVFIKDLSSSPDRNFIKRKLKNEEKEIRKISDKLVKIKNRNLWLDSFILYLEDLVSGKEIDSYNINSGQYDSKTILLNDSSIKGTGILELSGKLNYDFKYINKAIRKLDFYGFELPDIDLSKLPSMFFVDIKKYKKGLRQFNILLLKISKFRENLVDEKKSLDGLNSEDLNNRRKDLNKVISLIGLLINKLESFKSSCLEIRKIVKKIDFNDVIFSDNSIYTEKFLYDILIDVVFEGKFSLTEIDEKSDKFRVKLNSIFGNGDIPVDDIIQSIRIILNNDNIKKTKSKNKLKIYISKIKDQIDLYKKEEEDLSFSIAQFSSFNGLYYDMIGVLDSIFKDGYIDSSKVNKNIVLNFTRTLKDLSFSNFDQKLKDLILKLGAKNTVAFGQLFEDLEQYEYLLSEINGYDSIDSTYFRYERSIEQDHDEYDFEYDRQKVLIRIDMVKGTTRKLNDIIDRLKI